MREEVRLQLLDVNRRFYNTFAEAFTGSRAASEPGLERVLVRIRPGERVLDLGCGPARLAHLLPEGCAYVGIDYAEGMIRVAEEATTELAGVRTRFLVADLEQDAWHEHLGDPFDWVVMRAVLHHIPGYESRSRVLGRAASVLGPQGCVVIANWQFLKIERLRRRLLPWSTIGLAAEDVEPGDYLLDWQRQGRGTRYVHLIDEAETARLAHDAGLRVAQMFYDDGHTRDLTLYALLARDTPDATSD